MLDILSRGGGGAYPAGAPTMVITAEVQQKVVSLPGVLKASLGKK